MHEQILAPSAAAHVNQLFTEYGGLIGLALLAIGMICILVGLLDTQHFRRILGALVFMVLATAICGVALYWGLGRFQASNRAPADYGFIAAHFIVIGFAIAAVSTPLIGLGQVRRDDQRSLVAWWLSRFGWGYFVVFVTAPVVGAVIENLLARHPDMQFAPQGTGLVIIGQVFGAVVGWLVVGPIAGVLNVLRVPMQRSFERVPSPALAAGGAAFSLLGLLMASLILPLAHTPATSLVLR